MIDGLATSVMTSPAAAGAAPEVVKQSAKKFSPFSVDSLLSHREKGINNNAAAANGIPRAVVLPQAQKQEADEADGDDKGDLKDAEDDDGDDDENIDVCDDDGEDDEADEGAASPRTVMPTPLHPRFPPLGLGPWPPPPGLAPAGIPWLGPLRVPPPPPHGGSEYLAAFC